jgi:quercetin dioxygenase-like cupin family protein
MWDRAYIPQLCSTQLPWEDAATVAPTLAPGTQVRILSRDSGANASTCMWRIPAGWSHPDPFRLTGDQQLFILEGALTSGTAALGSGCYACHEAGALHQSMSSAAGAIALVMWDGWAKSDDTGGTSREDGGITMIDTTSVDGRPTPIEGPVPGILVKMLRNVPATGGMTLLMTIPPGWHEPRSEHHDCHEESFKLDGDIWIMENGVEQVLNTGDYFYRPPRIKHGPMRTESGTTSLIRFSATLVNHYGPL